MNTLQKLIDKDKITPFYVSWSQLEQQIASLHGNKEKTVELKMKQGIEIYKALLAQCHSEDEKLEPLNNRERLAFIEGKCSTYASFRQLQELFNEMQKKIASKRAILNRK